MSATETQRTIMAKQIALLLGDQMIDIELDPEHYDTAISIALERLRQRSDGALEEDDIFIHVQPNVSEYTLPKEVQEVRRLYRRGVGAHTAGGINFDPVDAAFFNMHLLQPGKSGGLATWDFYNQFLETTERVFASQYNYVWHKSTNTLRLINKPTAEEDVMVRVWTSKAEDAILLDPYTAPWIRSYALALCKHMLGQALGRFAAGVPSANGNVQFNGSELMQQSVQEIEKLDKELKDIVCGGDGYGFIIG
jgi:hypothetical protein